MIMNNENKKLKLERERRIEQKIEMHDKLKSLLNKIKTEKKNKSFDKTKHLEIELVKVKSANNPTKLQSELKESDKIRVFEKI